MKKTYFQTYLFTFLLINLSMLAMPGSQMAEIKMPDLNATEKNPQQPTTQRDFQQPADGEFKANPTFFAARSNDDRCKAIQIWLTSIRYEAKEARRYRAASGSGEVDMMGVYVDDIRKYGIAAFRNVFGKSFAELSKDEIKDIEKSLKKCSSDRWVEVALAQRLQIDARYWIADFDKVEQAARQAKAARDRRTYIERSREEARRTGYSIGELLKETELYRLHASVLSNYADWCSPQDGRAFVSLIFKADANFQIDNNERYWKRFEDEIFPAINARCNGINKIYISNYVQGFYINLARYQVNRQIDAAYPSDVLSLAVYSREPSAPQKYDWIYGNATTNALSYVAQYGSRAGRRDYSTGGINNDSSLTSIARLREVLQIREREEQARREKQAQDDLARRIEAQRQAEIAQREKIARAREAQRLKAAEVLRLYKKGAPAKYNFSGFERENDLQSIYSGDFEPYTDGQDSDVFDESRLFKLYFSGASLDQAFAELSKLTAIARLRLPIHIAYFTYHKVFEEECHSNRELTWSPEAFRTDIVKYKGFFETGRIIGQTYVYDVREPFAQTFRNTYRSVNQGGLAHLMTGVPLTTRYEFENGFRKFLRTEGCASPATRHLEVNLYLATEWLLPLQELLQMPGSANQSAQGVKSSNSQQFRVYNHLPTTVQVRQGDKINVTARGTIVLGPLAGSSDPDGIGGYTAYSYVSSAPHGSLLVRLQQEQNGNWVRCGRACSFTAERDGILEFLVNDRDSANNSGSYVIQVQVDKK
jgi:hypothetical protein